MPNPIVVERTAIRSSGITEKRHYYWCPGCDALHGIAILPDKQENGAGWSFEGTLECPTYSPSQLTTFTRWTGKEGGEQFVCHTFIKQGMIQFLGDCTHSLKNTTVPLPPLPDWMCREDNDGEDK